MSVWLAGPTIRPGVEKGKQSALVMCVSIYALGLPCAQARIRHLQIILLQEVRLLLVGLGGEDEVVGDDWEFVQDEDVAGMVL